MSSYINFLFVFKIFIYGLLLKKIKYLRKEYPHFSHITFIDNPPKPSTMI